ncbi:MAG: ankyrin repeat domain-containing protein [Endozoicomonadaceae bacterium]|nr:ankyrin repeat domain-containing protein [Endozoicomonadaceae bacterium]
MGVSVCSDAGNGKNCIRTASGECSGVYRNSAAESSKGTQNSSKGHRFKLPGFSFLTKIFPSIKNKKRSQNSLDKFRDGTEKRQKCSFRVMLINCICCLLIKMTVSLLASTALASDSPNQEMQTHSQSEVEDNPGYLTSFVDSMYARFKDNDALVHAAMKGGDTTKKVEPLPENQYYITVRRTPPGKTILMNAAMGGSEKIVKSLLNYKDIDVDLQNDDGVTALMYAAMGGHEKCVKHFLNKRANVNLKDNDGKIALMYAMRQTVIDINTVKCLLQHSNLDSEMRRKVLHEAAKYDNAECINLLLDDSRFDVNAKDESQFIADWKAGKFSHDKEKITFLDKNGEIDIPALMAPIHMEAIDIAASEMADLEKSLSLQNSKEQHMLALKSKELQ